MKVAIIQVGIRESENRSERVERVVRRLQQLKDVDLIVFPEIWATGYFSFDRYQTEADTMDGEFVHLLKEQARTLGSWLYTGSFVEEDGGQYYNTSLLIDREGNVRGKYRKIHLFRYNSQEGEILTPGTELGIVDTEWGKVAMSTCFDIRFPELYRAQLDQGAKLFLVTAAWPHRRLDHWRLFNRARALENQCFLISGNMAGTDHGIVYGGHSQIVNPWGVVIASADEDEAVVEATIDLNEVDRIRESFPQIKHRVL